MLVLFGSNSQVVQNVPAEDQTYFIQRNTYLFRILNISYIT